MAGGDLGAPRPTRLAPLEAMVEARFVGSWTARGSPSVAALDAHGSMGRPVRLMALALSVLAGCSADAAVARPAARAWALTGLIRQRSHSGVDRLPDGLGWR